jgi:beta-glucanase (GH16 family)
MHTQIQRHITLMLLLCGMLLVACNAAAAHHSSINTVAKLATPTPPIQVQMPGWHLQWDDEFQDDTLNALHWTIANTITNHYLGCCLRFGSQAWSPDNVSQSGGLLHIVTRYAQDGRYLYTSGAVSTESTYSFLYGRIDVRARMPQSTSLWPAFWLIPADTQGQEVAAFEVDFAEAWESDPHSIYAFFHQGHEQTYCQAHGPDFTANFHTFSLIWDPTELQWLIDNKVQCTMRTNVPDIPMALILDTAIDGKNEPVDQSTILPQTTNIDFVRIWSRS